MIADPIRGKGYLEIRPDRESAARYGVSIGDVNDVTETAIGGRIATTTVEGRERHAVRVRYQRDWVRDEEAIRRLPIPVRDNVEPSTELASVGSSGVLVPRGCRLRTRFVPLEDVARVNIVEGPATIKSENGLLRNYVRLNVQGRGVVEFLEAARRAVRDEVELPEGTYIEWTGQFEHALTTARTLLVVIPIVIASIFLILYLTYHDWADACLMLLAVPGTFAGGVLFQWLFGFKFSVAVGVGYIACFGMAASTGMIMLVYLREAVANAGGLEKMTLARSVRQGGHRRGRAPAASQITDRRHDDSGPGTHVVGVGRGSGSHPPHGRTGFRWNFDRRRSHRSLVTRAILSHSPAAAMVMKLQTASRIPADPR